MDKAKDIFTIGDLRIVASIEPIFYEDSEIVASFNWDNQIKKFITDNNPSRIIDGPLSKVGEELEPPLKDEFEHWINDCVFLMNELGFHIISRETSQDSKKSEYVVVYGIEDRPCGTLIFDIRLSDHFADNLTFPESLKNDVVNFLNMNNILDGTATKEGIDFCLEKVTVGSVKHDTWDRAFNRLYIKLKEIKRKIQVRLNSTK